jgi:hypothetical protein
MTAPDPEPPNGGMEYPPLEDLPPAVDPYAPVDYSSNYSGSADFSPRSAGLPPPVYPSQYPTRAGYPGRWADPYDPYCLGAPPGTNGKAIAALVAAVVGVPACMCFAPSVVGVVLGLIAIGETKNTGQSGHGLAVAAVMIGIATLLLGGIFGLVGMIGA